MCVFKTSCLDAKRLGRPCAGTGAAPRVAGLTREELPSQEVTGEFDPPVASSLRLFTGII